MSAPWNVNKDRLDVPCDEDVNGVITSAAVPGGEATLRDESQTSTENEHHFAMMAIKAPKRSIVQMRLRFDDDVRIIEVGMDRSANMKGEFLYSTRQMPKDPPGKAIDPGQITRIRNAEVDYIVARRKATDLAIGVGNVLDDSLSENAHVLASGPLRLDDALRPTVLWDGDAAWIVQRYEKRALWDMPQKSGTYYVRIPSEAARKALSTLGMWDYVDHLYQKGGLAHPTCGTALRTDSALYNHEASDVEDEGGTIAAARDLNNLVSYWLIDSGSGHDLINVKTVSHFPEILEDCMGKGVEFSTANGKTRSTHIAKINVPEICEQIRANVLHSAPAVLSLGKRIQAGCSFQWHPDIPPWLTLPDKRRIEFDVFGGIPYMKTGAPILAPVQQGGASSSDGPMPPAPPPAAEPPGDGPAGGAPDNENEVGNDEERPRRGRNSDKLRKEAISTTHLLRHKPFNSWCDACVQGKMKEKQHRRGGYRREPKRWGELVTCDYLIGKNESMKACTGHLNALNLKDLYTKMIACIPVKQHNTEATIRAINKFKGAKTIRTMYSDQGDELINACADLSINHELAQPGVPVTNSLAERNNQEILNGTRTILIQAGFPACFWSYAAPHFCFMENTHSERGKDSPYKLAHGEEFAGNFVPFGARVYFKPSNTRARDQPSKWEGRGMPGIFAGYDLHPGGKWAERYLVWPIEQFRGISLASNADPDSMSSVLKPHTTGKVEKPSQRDGVPDEAWHFPLKKKYDKENSGIDEPGPLDEPGDDEVGPEDSGSDKEAADGAAGTAPPPRPYGPHDYILKDGQWYRAKANGVLMRVDASGSFIRKGTKKPDDVQSEVWNNMTNAERKAAILADGRPDSISEEEWLQMTAEERKWEKEQAKQMKERVEGPATSSVVIQACHSFPKLGIEGAYSAVPSTMYIYDMSTEEGESSDGEGDSSDAADSPAVAAPVACTAPDDRTVTPWDNWNSWAETLEGGSHGEAVAASAVGYVQDGRGDRVPAMPTVPTVAGHRHHISASNHQKVYNALVARPVSKKEIERTPAAQAAMDKEWNKLRQKNVWDETVVREWDDVAAEAKAKGEEVNFGWLFGICVEKGSELKPGDPNRKFKGRVVFQGNRVVNQDWEAAMFEDLGSSPATLEASRVADMYGSAPGHDCQMADAEQAYIQAELRGTKTWICIPPEARGDNLKWDKKGKVYRFPVVQLKKALYGHPDSGTFWEKHCDKHLQQVGFEPVGQEWPSCYRHKKLNLFLIVYVDDFKMAGPAKNLKQGWEMIRSGLGMEDPQPLGAFLGCRHEEVTIPLPKGVNARGRCYNMELFFRQCVELYKELAPGVRLRDVETPFLPEDMNQSVAGRPRAEGPVVECCFCSNLVPADKVWKSAKEHERAQREEKRAVVKEEFDDSKKGRLAPVAAKILMKILYGARAARMDLLRMIGCLACHFTRWTSECDLRLHRLVSYINSTLHLRQIGWIGDPLSQLQPHLFADANFAGCLVTQRSTTGMYMCIRGPNSCWPVAGISKRQGCVSHSTPEAEIVACAFALRNTGIPSKPLWDALFPHKPPLYVHEDNQAMMRVLETGKNPTMRYLARTHRVSVAWLHEVCQGRDVILGYEESAKMCADIFTKAFGDSTKWRAARKLINVLSTEDLAELKKTGVETTMFPDPSAPAMMVDPVHSCVKEHDNLPMNERLYERVKLRLQNSAWPKQQRAHTWDMKGYGKAFGTCLGATFEKGQPRIGHMTKPMEGLVKDINRLIGLALEGKGFAWGSLQINVNAVSERHTDKNNEGLSMIGLFGRFRGGKYMCSEANVTFGESGRWLVIDGKREHWSEQFIGNRISVVAFLHESTGDLSAKDYEYLHDLGFRPRPDRWRRTAEIRTIKQVNSRSIMSDGKLANLISNVSDEHDVLWYTASQCYHAGGNFPGSVGHDYKQFRKTWRQFEILGHHAMKVGAPVYFDMPRNCPYWGMREVMSFCEQYKMKIADFDGCMIADIPGQSKDRRSHRKLPWRMACPMRSSLPAILDRKCDGSHAHVSGDSVYNHSFGRAVWEALMQSLEADSFISSRCVTCIHEQSIIDHGVDESVGSHSTLAVACLALDQPLPDYPGDTFSAPAEALGERARARSPLPLPGSPFSLSYNKKPHSRFILKGEMEAGGSPSSPTPEGGDGGAGGRRWGPKNKATWEQLKERPVPRGLGAGGRALQVLRPIIEMIEHRASVEAVSDAVDNVYMSGEFAETVSNREDFINKTYMTMDVLLRTAVSTPDMEVKVSETSAVGWLAHLRQALMLVKKGGRYRRSRDVTQLKPKEDYIAEMYGTTWAQWTAQEQGGSNVAGYAERWIGSSSNRKKKKSAWSAPGTVCQAIYDEYRGKYYGDPLYPYYDCLGITLPHTPYENEIRMHWRTVEGPRPTTIGTENVPSATMWLGTLTETVASYMSLRTPMFGPRELESGYNMFQLASVLDHQIKSDQSSLPVTPAEIITGAVRTAPNELQESLCVAYGIEGDNATAMVGEQWPECLAPGCTEIDDSYIRADMGGCLLADAWWYDKTKPVSDDFSQYVPHYKTKYFAHYEGGGLKPFIGDLKRYILAEKEGLANDPYKGHPVFSHLRPLFICFSGSFLYDGDHAKEPSDKEVEEFGQIIRHFGSIVYMRIPDGTITGAEVQDKRVLRAADLRLAETVMQVGGAVVSSEGYWKMLACFRRKYKDGSFAPHQIGTGHDDGAGYMPIPWIWESWLFNAKRLAAALAIGTDAKLYVKDATINISLQDAPPQIDTGHMGDYSSFTVPITPGEMRTEEEAAKVKTVMEWYMAKGDDEDEDYRTDDEDEAGGDSTKRSAETGGTHLDYYGLVEVRAAFCHTEHCSCCGKPSSRCCWVKGGTVWLESGDDRFWCDRCFTMRLEAMYEEAMDHAADQSEIIDRLIDRWVPSISTGRPSSKNLNIAELMKEIIRKNGDKRLKQLSHFGAVRMPLYLEEVDGTKVSPAPNIGVWGGRAWADATNYYYDLAMERIVGREFLNEFRNERNMTNEKNWLDFIGDSYEIAMGYCYFRLFKGEMFDDPTAKLRIIKDLRWCLERKVWYTWRDRKADPFVGSGMTVIRSSVQDAIARQKHRSQEDEFNKQVMAQPRSGVFAASAPMDLGEAASLTTQGATEICMGASALTATNHKETVRPFSVFGQGPSLHYSKEHAKNETNRDRRYRLAMSEKSVGASSASEVVVAPRQPLALVRATPISSSIEKPTSEAPMPDDEELYNYESVCMDCWEPHAAIDTKKYRGVCQRCGCKLSRSDGEMLERGSIISTPVGVAELSPSPPEQSPRSSGAASDKRREEPAMTIMQWLVHHQIENPIRAARVIVTMFNDACREGDVWYGDNTATHSFGNAWRFYNNKTIVGSMTVTEKMMHTLIKKLCEEGYMSPASPMFEEKDNFHQRREMAKKAAEVPPSGQDITTEEFKKLQATIMEGDYHFVKRGGQYSAFRAQCLLIASMNPQIYNSLQENAKQSMVAQALRTLTYSVNCEDVVKPRLQEALEQLPPERLEAMFITILRYIDFVSGWLQDNGLPALSKPPWLLMGSFGDQLDTAKLAELAQDDIAMEPLPYKSTKATEEAQEDEAARAAREAEEARIKEEKAEKARKEQQAKDREAQEIEKQRLLEEHNRRQARDMARQEVTNPSHAEQQLSAKGMTSEQMKNILTEWMCPPTEDGDPEVTTYNRDHYKNYKEFVRYEVDMNQYNRQETGPVIDPGWLDPPTNDTPPPGWPENAYYDPQIFSHADAHRVIFNPSNPDHWPTCTPPEIKHATGPDEEANLIGRAIIQWVRHFGWHDCDRYGNKNPAPSGTDTGLWVRVNKSYDAKGIVENYGLLEYARRRHGGYSWDINESRPGREIRKKIRGVDCNPGAITAMTLARIVRVGHTSQEKLRYQAAILVNNETGKIYRDSWESFVQMRVLVGHTCTFQDLGRLSLPVSPEFYKKVRCLFHRTQKQYMDSILARGVIPGGLERTGRVRYIQVSPFATSDTRCEQGGRQGHAANIELMLQTEMIIKLGYDIRIDTAGNVYISQGGATTDVVPPRCIWKIIGWPKGHSHGERPSERVVIYSRDLAQFNVITTTNGKTTAGVSAMKSDAHQQIVPDQTVRNGVRYNALTKDERSFWPQGMPIFRCPNCWRITPGGTAWCMCDWIHVRAGAVQNMAVIYNLSNLKELIEVVENAKGQSNLKAIIYNLDRQRQAEVGGPTADSGTPRSSASSPPSVAGSSGATGSRHKPKAPTTPPKAPPKEKQPEPVPMGPPQKAQKLNMSPEQKNSPESVLWADIASACKSYTRWLQGDMHQRRAWATEGFHPFAMMPSVVSQWFYDPDDPNDMPEPTEMLMKAKADPKKGIAEDQARALVKWNVKVIEFIRDYKNDTKCDLRLVWETIKREDTIRQEKDVTKKDLEEHEEDLQNATVDKHDAIQAFYYKTYGIEDMKGNWQNAVDSLMCKDMVAGGNRYPVWESYKSKEGSRVGLRAPSTVHEEGDVTYREMRAARKAQAAAGDKIKEHQAQQEKLRQQMEEQRAREQAASSSSQQPAGQPVPQEEEEEDVKPSLESDVNWGGGNRSPTQEPDRPEGAAAAKRPAGPPASPAQQAKRPPSALAASADSRDLMGLIKGEQERGRERERRDRGDGTGNVSLTPRARSTQSGSVTLSERGARPSAKTRPPERPASKPPAASREQSAGGASRRSGDTVPGQEDPGHDPRNPTRQPTPGSAHDTEIAEEPGAADDWATGGGQDDNPWQQIGRGGRAYNENDYESGRAQGRGKGAWGDYRPSGGWGSSSSTPWREDTRGDYRGGKPAWRERGAESSYSQDYRQSTSYGKSGKWSSDKSGKGHYAPYGSGKGKSGRAAPSYCTWCANWPDVNITNDGHYFWGGCPLRQIHMNRFNLHLCVWCGSHRHGWRECPNSYNGPDDPPYPNEQKKFFHENVPRPTVVPEYAFKDAIENYEYRADNWTYLRHAEYLWQQSWISNQDFEELYVRARGKGDGKLSADTMKERARKFMRENRQFTHGRTKPNQRMDRDWP